MSIHRYDLQLTENLSISKIKIDQEIHVFSKLNDAVISEFSEAMQRGADFPPITVFYDGSEYWLADGFHRIKAKEANGDRNILAEVEFGSRHEAKLYAVRN
ncbi:hypothetical protein [Acaryochloris sp. CCMEE 5410]|uniref:hypothetical protein n=1 Tax=Acaryochloris sp. CCMEE 5410 TaxID=310037 RepID=UPI0002485068|nr:hypothetical protein [Acaryochloris sp. CCMEE 5410]KAI9129462.1 hypothetical protein ON05_035765 [Acaryochloris sp. CCMEE 5410]